MFRLLRAGIEKHTAVRSRLASGSGSLAFYRSIVEELRPLLEKDMEEEPIESFPLPCHPETGLKKIPPWALQPYVRPLPLATYKAIKEASSKNGMSGALEDMLTGGTGEERVIGQGKPLISYGPFCTQLDSKPHLLARSDGTTAGLAQPLIPEAQKCEDGLEPSLCKNLAAANCPRTGCLTHCRARGGIEAGQATTMVEAVKLAQSGKLTGLGCDAHEEKDRARKQRKIDQKKAYQVYKEAKRGKRNRGKTPDAASDGEGDGGQPDRKKVKVAADLPEEEEALNT
jgi:tRNA-dihydrouridine synthase 1